MSAPATDQQRSPVEWKFYRFWILTSAIGWPVGWAVVTFGHAPAGITALVLFLLFRIIEPGKPAQSMDWFRLSFPGFYAGFEFSWYTGNYNPVDLMAMAVLAGLVIAAYYVLVILVILGPIWLLLSFASLICPAERAKWRSLLLSTSAKSLVVEWFLNIIVLVVVVVVGGISSFLIHRLGATFGWPMISPEFSLVMRCVLGLTYGVILSRTGPRLISLINRKFHRPASLARQAVPTEEKNHGDNEEDNRRG